MTTLPPGVTIRTSSNNEYTTNTWSSSTNSDGHLIFFPIIVGCRDCTSLLTIIDGVDYFFNTIFKFPPIPFPKFPKIPKLHFPCVFFCKKGHKHHKDKPPVYDEPNKENEEKDQTSTTSATSSSSSSTSSCKASMVSACTVFSTVKVDGSSTTTMTSTTCSAETECSATGHSSTTATTTSATPTQTAYFITAKRDVGMDIINEFTAKLKVETDPDTLHVSGNEIFTGSWIQKLNDTQIESYKREPAVLSIHPLSDLERKVRFRKHRKISRRNSTASREALFKGDLKKRANTVIQQVTDDDPLKLVSQPPGVDSNLISTYAHDVETLPARVYVMDSGFDASHPLYDQLKQTIGEPAWIWPGSPQASTFAEPYIYASSGTYTDADEFDSHGTGMISRIVGPELGVSKKVALTIIRQPQAIPNQQEMIDYGLTTPVFDEYFNRISCLEEGLNLILADVRQKGVPKQSILNLSNGVEVGLDKLPVPGDVVYSMYASMKELVNMRVTIVVSAGNDALDMNGVYDARLVSEYTKWATDFDIIVVGGASINGNAWWDSKYQPAQGFPGSGVSVWAPAYKMRSACAVASGSFVVEDGATSTAAAMVSGLLAYFMGVQKHFNKMDALAKANPTAAWTLVTRSYVQQLARQRVIGVGANLLYNGEIPLDKAGNPVCQAPASAKRQTGSSCVRPDTPDPEASSSLASVSNASLASVSSASFASVSSASLASVSRASLASLSSASLASVRSALTASKTSTSALPVSTGTFSGYLGSTCLDGNDMVLEGATEVVALLCGRTYTWDTKGQPPRDVKGASTPAVWDSFTRDRRVSSGQISPNEEIGSACAGGTYPRSLTADECEKAFSRLFTECPTGGQLGWATEDHNGCMSFSMSQISPNSSPKPTSITTPPPEPTSPPPPPTSINNEKCFKSDQFEDQMFLGRISNDSL
ncbi:hypothetical protein ONS96_001518 [Cadophora gregata f. sp. sojae]|nr:hypothetical protein ONS96_001518 [Cadophora gregata f. sp. sojae]